MQPFTILGWRVDDIHREVDELSGRGVQFRRVEGIVQDDEGVWTTPDGTHVAWFEDPDGNTLSLSDN